MEDILVTNQKVYENGNSRAEKKDPSDQANDIRTNGSANSGALTENQKAELGFFAAMIVLSEIAFLAIVQLMGIYRFGKDIRASVVSRVGWSAYSSGFGVGLALFVVFVALYAYLRHIEIGAWHGFASLLQKIATVTLILAPLLGQVNTYSAMAKGLGAGVENASRVGTSISEALISTICGFAAFGILLVVYTFALQKEDEKEA